MSNYKAIIATIKSVEPIPNADRIQIAKVMGENCIVSKDWEVGMMGVFFPAGCQLSEKYCEFNNLYRNSKKNTDNTKQGFFEDNRRVRAQPFLKVRSEGFFAGLESLSFATDISKLKEGQSFEDIDGVNICKKFLIQVKTPNSQKKAIKKKAVPDFEQHVDTAQFKYAERQLEEGDLISIQAKVHGTSARYGYHLVTPPLSKWKSKINSLLPWNVFKNKAKYEYVAGTRRVILDSPAKEGFHGSEQYRFDVLETLKPFLEKGMTVYGEIAGYANGKPIMSNHSTKDLKDKKITKKYGENITYSYNCKEHEHRFHVYRITFTTVDGNTIDFTQQQLVDWCANRNIKFAMDVCTPFIYNGNWEELSAKVESLTERPDVLGEDYIDPSHPSEGVIVRVDRGTLTPLFLKSKSYIFKVMEGIASEKTIDIEDVS